MYLKMVSVSLHTNYTFEASSGKVAKENAGALPLFWKVTAYA
jgi:hypothetical protein